MPLMSLTLVPLFCEYVGFIRPHTRTYTSMWKYFAVFVYVLDRVVLGFGHMPQNATLDVLSARQAERIVERAGSRTGNEF